MAEKMVTVKVTTEKALIRHNGVDYGKDDSFTATQEEAEALGDFVEIGKEVKKSTAKTDDKASDSTKDDEDWNK